MTRKAYAPLLTTLVVIVMFSHAASAANWPGWRGANRDGISPENGWQKKWSAPEGPKVLWKAAIGTGFASIAIADGKVYSMGNQGDQDTLYCLDAATGKELWKYSYAEPLNPKMYEGGPNSTPLVDGGHVYTLSKRGKLHCLKADAAEVVWSKQLTDELKVKASDWGLSCSPLVLGERLIIDAGVIAAFNKLTGEPLWRTSDFGPAYSTPAVFERDGKTLLAALPASGLVLLDAADGKVLGQLKWKTSWNVNDTTPIVEKNRVHILTGYGKGEALIDIADPANPQIIWQKDTPNRTAQMSSSVLHQGKLYGFKGDTLRCIDFANGTPHWEQKGFGQGSMIMAGDSLIVLSDRGELAVVAASPDAYSESARAQVLGGKCWTSPAFADGKVFCRNARGDLLCLDLSQ